MWRVVVTKHSTKSLQKLPQDTHRRIFEKIEKAIVNPYSFFEKMSGKSGYRLRVGEYRVLADIDQLSKTIEITEVGHRKNIYKK